MEHHKSSGFFFPARTPTPRPIAIAMPRSPSHSPARAMNTHRTAVTVGHGDATANMGAKKNPLPTYHDEPARSEIMTNRSHRGTGGLTFASFGMTSGCRR